ncbi:T9SS type A sorting domain-containing protein [Hymenobacter chitinivorans]|uniref:Putative secreted protein (Por secretion system target) n=1 Tax=Hymenobacter chitinivorans DSM 11115 TaxID=1121954 RepID=A0A2M9BT17_9BACT|nr:T9SS type A sorting domain-containing protein [Hymenobacter chitinivorans]PJJ61095.1 putative secreted protein (Por secretion system target) [Hymenobacter chitinivorans DSM 11115]
MKNTYKSARQWVQKPHWRFLLLLLLALPFVGHAQSFSVVPADPANPQNFGSVAVGSFSAAKSYTVTGASLTMPVTVALSGTGYEISRDNITFSGSAFDLAPDASGNINTVVYARFRPTSGTPGTTINRTLSFTSDEASTITFNLTGTRAAGTPTVTADPTSRSFGNQVVNSPSAPQTTVVSGTSLTGPITVTAPAGFQVSVGSGAYASSVTLTPVSGAVSSTTVNIRFLPTAAQSYVDNVVVSSPGANTVNVGVSGTGVLPTPVLTATPSTLADFGQVTVGSSSSIIRTFNVSGADLQGPVTITPPSGFRIRTGTNFFSTSALTLTPTNGTLATTAIDVVFSPTVVQQYANDITVTSTNATTQLVRVTGEGTPSSGIPVVTVNPGALNFGTVTSSGGTSTRSFEVSGTDLTAGIVLSPSSPNIEIRNASAGGSFTKSPLTINPVSGTVSSQIIEVRLVALVAAGNFNERIDVTSTGAEPKLVSITAVNTSGAISDISVSNPNGNEFTFVTRPTTQSVSQSYLLAGTNLIDPLIVQPIGPNASYFQVSADNINFVSQLSFTPDNQGNVTQRPIYVRFVPGVNAITVTADIRNSSAPAPNFDVSVTGISEPTIRLDRAIGTFPDNIVKGTTSASTTVRLDGFLLAGDVTVQFPNESNPRNPTGIPQFEFSLDNGVTYVKSASITPDGEGNFTRNLLVRFAPTRVGNAAQELLFTNASFFNGSSFALTSGFGRTSGFSIATEPTVQSTATIVRNGTSATITFNLSNPPAGTSYGQNRLVIASSTYTKLPVSLFPRDKQNFNPGTTVNGAYVFGSGTVIEASSNTYVVFSAASDNFTVTGLDPNLTYNFFAFEFNNDNVLNAENYRVPNNEPQNPLPVELVSFTAKVRDNSVVLNWATASETNNRGFEVQRSSDAKTFTTIDFKQGAGTATTRTKYEAIDTKPLAGVSYYRLKQIDEDGTASYSKTLAVTTKLTEVSVYPNPTQGADVVNIALPSGTTEGLLVRITDLSGRQIRQARLSSQGELSTQDLKPGTYIIVVGEGETKVSRKLIKN